MLSSAMMLTGTVTAATTYYAEVTIGSGEVGADLSNYPVMVRLADMPAAFWTHVKPDGGDIRVKTTGGTLVPCDLVRFDYQSEDGVLFFLASSVLAASSNTWRIHYGDPSLERLPVTDTNGRNAVWATYTAVFVLGETAGDDRTGGALMDLSSDPDLFELIDTSPDLDAHQGVCWDGTYFYVTDTNRIDKYDASWSLVDSNADPIGDAAIGGSPTIDHCGAPEIHDGKLYIPMEKYPASGGLYNGHIGVFDAATLAFIQAFDISAQAHESSAIAFCPVDGTLYLTDYDGNNSTIYKYDPNDGSYEGTLTTSSALVLRQGITWWRGYFWISIGGTACETLRVAYDGTVSPGGVGFGAGQSDYEGIGHTEEELLQLIDPSGGGPERVEVRRPYDLALCAGGGAAHGTNGIPVANGRTSLTTFTLGVSAAISSKGQNRVAMSYWDESAGGTDTRVVIAYRNASTSLAIWDPTNSWLVPSSIVNPTLNQMYRLHAVYNGTTHRKVYIDGTVRNTQNGNAAAPAALDTIRLMSEDTSNSELWQGQVGFAYLYPGVLSDAYIAAEYSNLNAPASFYSIGSEVTV